MLNHILVPLDGSPLAEEALDYARELVGQSGQISLVCAVEGDDVLTYGPAMMPLVRGSKPTFENAIDSLLPQASGYLAGMAQTLQDHGYRVQHEARLGDAPTVIVEVAREHAVDAIVMSTHGRSGLGRWLFGSVTAKVLETAACPVFVIPSADKRAVRHAELRGEQQV